MNTKRSVNVYDFDHTIYDGDASVRFIVFCMWHNPLLWRYLPLQALAICRYVIGVYDRKQVKQTAFLILRGIKDIDATVDRFWKNNMHRIKPWYLGIHKNTDIIISASPEFLLKPVVNSLGIKSLIATKMDKNTGRIIGKNCRAYEKVRRLRAYDRSLDIDTCYSDSLSDEPLFDIAKKAYLVKRHKIIPYNKRDA